MRKSQEIEFSVMQKEDIPSLLKLYRQYSDQANFIPCIEQSEMVWEQIQQTDTTYFVAKDNDKVVASCYIAIIPNLTWNATPIGFIENVITDEKYRHRGLGSKVLQMAIDLGKSRNTHKLVLLSAAHRESAHSFYYGLGFDGDAKFGFVMYL